jgi:PAS domain S-box-containing protein
LPNSIGAAKATAYSREAALRETHREKDFLASLLEHASQPFAVGYPDERLGRINRAYEQLTSYTAAELRSLDWSTMLTPPEWRELEKEKLDELGRTGQPVRYAKEYIRKDGSRLPIENCWSTSCARRRRNSSK